MACRAKWCACAICNPAGNFVERSKMNKPSWFRFERAASAHGHCAASALLALSALFLAMVARSDSLWNDKAVPRPIVADKRAAAVGDILSILVQESSEEHTSEL